MKEYVWYKDWRVWWSFVFTTAAAVRLVWIS
jgi:hypothetical protein